jgi:hypothetical protein
MSIPRFQSSSFYRFFGLALLVSGILLLIHGSAFAQPHPQAKSGPKGTVLISSMTSDVKVYIDGKLIGKTPFEKPIPIKAGKHKLKATKAGHSTLEFDFTVLAGKKTEFAVDLIPFSGLVKFSCNVDGAQVQVDGKPIGLTPLIQEIVAGDHEILITKDGHQPFTTAINVKGGEKHFIEGTLVALNFAPDNASSLQNNIAEQSSPSAPAWYSNLYKKWWVWAVAGAIVVTVITAPLLSGDQAQSGISTHNGSPHTVIDLGKP